MTEAARFAVLARAALVGLAQGEVPSVARRSCRATAQGVEACLGARRPCCGCCAKTARRIVPTPRRRTSLDDPRDWACTVRCHELRVRRRAPRRSPCDRRGCWCRDHWDGLRLGWREPSARWMALAGGTGRQRRLRRDDGAQCHHRVLRSAHAVGVADGAGNIEYRATAGPATCKQATPGHSSRQVPVVTS